MMFSVETNTDANFDKYTRVSELVQTSQRLQFHFFQKVLKPYLKTEHLCRGSGSQHTHILPKVVKFIQPINGPELPVLIILLADWRC